MKLVNAETQKMCMDQTNTEPVENVTPETMEKLDKVYEACAPVVFEDLERIESIYYFRDDVPDCFVLRTPNGDTLCVSEKMAEQSTGTLKICMVGALVDAVMYGPETVVNIKKLQEAE